MYILKDTQLLLLLLEACCIIIFCFRQSCLLLDVCKINTLQSVLHNIEPFEHLNYIKQQLFTLKLYKDKAKV